MQTSISRNIDQHYHCDNQSIHTVAAKIKLIKETKIEKPKAYSLETSAPHSNNFVYFEKIQKEKLKERHNQDWHWDWQNYQKDSIIASKSIQPSLISPKKKQ